MIVLPVNIFIRKQVIFMTINDLKDKVISGGLITIDDALFLSEADLDDLCKAADEIQHTFLGINQPVIIRNSAKHTKQSYLIFF